MFTGLIEGVGKVLKIESFEQSSRIVIESPFSLENEKIGDSIAINGCCLTLVQKNQNSFAVDVSPETLNRTTLGELIPHSSVNLERAVRLQDRLGGHLVQGHVDGIATIHSKKELKTGGENFLLFEFSYPSSSQKYLIEKGSITVDGISLTLNTVDEKFFTVCLIPHSQRLTTLTEKKEGDRVNLEIDLIAKYVEKLMCASSSSPKKEFS